MYSFTIKLNSQVKQSSEIEIKKMKSYIVLISLLVVAIDCQDSGFRLDPLRILGNGGNLNTNGFNRNDLNNYNNLNNLNNLNSLNNAGRLDSFRASSSSNNLGFFDSNNLNQLNNLNNLNNQQLFNPKRIVILNDLNSLNLLRINQHPLNNNNLALGFNAGQNQLTFNRLNSNGLPLRNGFKFATIGTHLGLKSNNHHLIYLFFFFEKTKH